MQQQLATWQQSQYLMQKRRRPQKTFIEVAGRRTFQMHADF
jgi:hypothetical protein